MPIARTALLNIAERLRRAFRSAGEIPLDLGKTVDLSSIVADLREPGNSPYRGRFFAAGISAQNAAVGNTAWALRNVDAVVYHLCVISQAGTSADTINIFLLDPTTNALNVPGTQAGSWTDQKENPTDQPPLLDNNNQWLADATAYNVTQRVVSFVPGQSGQIIVPVTIHAPANSTLVVRLNLGATRVMGFSVFGKIF